MNEFHYTSYAQEVIFGPGSIARLGEAINRFGWRHVMLCSSGSLRRDGSIAAVENALGERLVGIYERTKSYVPDFQVAEVLELAEQDEVDALIGMGGGSPLGLAKAVSLALEEKHGEVEVHATTPLAQPLVPVVAIPTTYAGSEMTPVYGGHTGG